VESVLALASFAVLVAGIMELGFAGFAANSVSFAAQLAARFAAVRGSASGHAASVADVQAVAQQYAAPLSTGAMTVALTWSPDKSPGSTVEVRVSYSFAPEMMPVASRVLTFQSKARQVIVQ